MVSASDSRAHPARDARRRYVAPEAESRGRARRWRTFRSGRLGLVLLVAFSLVACARTPEPPFEVVQRLFVVGGPLTPSGAVRRCELALESRATLGCLETISSIVPVPPIEDGRLEGRFVTPPEALGRPAAVDARLRYGKDKAHRILPLMLLRDPLGPEFDAAFLLPSDTAPGGVELEVRVRSTPPTVQSVETAEITVERGAVLETGIALDPIGKWVGGSAVEMVLEARTASGATPLSRAVLDPEDPATERWTDRRVPLDAIAGKPAHLVFRSRVLAPPGGEAEPAFGFPLWGTANVLARRPRGEQRNVILISIDTLRADALGVYGSANPTSPSLDALARDGALFEQAMSAWPSTLVSHMNMLTGVYPAVFGGMEGLRQPLPAAIETLPEVLGRHGYATAAVTEDGYVVAKLGFQRGFDSYGENRGVLFADAQGEAAKTFADGLAWVRAHPDEKFFLFLHTYQVHGPYNPPPEFNRFFTYKVDGVDRPIDLGAPRGARARALYAGEVLYTDKLLGDLFGGLDALDLARSTIVAVTGDHGEAFGEHGLFGHANGVLGEVLRVPLLVRAPGLVPPGLRIPGQASLVDVAPTLLGLVGLDAPPSVQGRSLARALRGESPGGLEGNVAFAEHHVKDKELAAARDGSHKWVFDLRSNDPAKVFDVRDDPWEQNPLDDPALQAHGDELRRAYFAAAAEKRAQLALDTAAAPGPAATPDPETAAKLRALGYTD